MFFGYEDLIAGRFADSVLTPLAKHLTDHMWAVVALWAVLYTSDWLLTLRGARIYQRLGCNWGGDYELNPNFQEDIKRLRPWNSRFVGWLGWTSIFLVGTAYLMPVTFAFWTGAFLLTEVVVHTRHVKNLVYLRHLEQDEDAGSIRRPRWLSYRLSAVELYGFAFLLLLLTLVTGSEIIAGGAFGCLYTAWSHSSLAQKAKSSPGG